MCHLPLLIERLQKRPYRKDTVIIAGAADVEILNCVIEAVRLELCSFILLGDKNEIESMLKKIGVRALCKEIKIKHAPQQMEKAAVEYVRKGKATVIMKGNTSTKYLLQAVLARTIGLRTEHLLSHVAVFDIPGRINPVILTDAAVNIAPSLNEKIEIVEHAVDVANLIGVKNPKVAAIAPVDVINEAIPSTLDAAKLTELNKQGEIVNCLIGGPISFDNAISYRSAQHKQSMHKVSGISDILMVPTIEVGNALYKSFTFFAHATVAGVICGAKVPIVLPSRADSRESKLYSLVLGLLMNNNYETLI